tara:strand:- start:258 stop:869 length:612 start_codon:yes stop_codon:yes gene_type:complete
MNYGDIKTHFEALLNRSDITTALTTTFVDQSIARIQRQLRTPLNESVTTYTISGQTASVTLPNDFLEIISVYLGAMELSRVPMSKFRQYAANSYAGNPVAFARQQSKLQLHPQPSTGDLVLYYYSEFPAMTANSDENSLAAVASDLIIYGALTFASDYYLDERGTLFEEKFNQFLLEIQEQANDQELNGGVQVIQPSATYTDY